jgi:hypothetical protein
MRTRSIALALLIAFAPATFSVVGWSQTTDDPTIKAARARFSEGVEFFDKGQYENARAAFLQAYALRKHPSVLINLAQSCLRSGHALEAARYFEQYLRESSSLTAAQRGDAERGLSEARSKLGRLEISAAEGAEIFVDGEHVGTAPLADPLNVEPGVHVVKANAESRSAVVGAGQLLPVKFSPVGGAANAEVVSAPAPLPPAPSLPVVPEGAPPAQPEPAEPPRERTEVGVSAATSSPGLFSRPKTMAPVWLGLTVGLAGGATAILFAVFKSDANTNYQNDQSTIETAATQRGIPQQGLCEHPSANFSAACASLQNDQNLVNTDALVANVALGVGIAGLAFGLGWYLFAPKRVGAPATLGETGAFLPIVGPSLRGFGYARSFE